MVVTGIDDITYEGTETIIVDVVSVVNGSEHNTQQQTVNIIDNETAPTISVNDISITEGGTGVITVTLSTPTTGNVTVNFTLTGATARSGLDYQHTGGTITITAGTTGATRVLATSGDTIYE